MANVYFFGNSNSLFINSNSCVGIGKSNPAYTLDVAGNLNFSGTLNQNGAPYGGSQYRNRIINGDMRLDQTLTSSNAIVIGSMTATTGASNTVVDRWQAVTGIASGSLCAQQVALSTADQVATGNSFNKATILSQVPMNGLTTYIPFDGSSATDLMGNATSASMNGTASYSTTTCKIGTTALNLTGNAVPSTTQNAYLTYTPPAITVPITVAFWVYCTTFSGSSVPVYFGSTASSGFSYQFVWGSGTLYVDAMLNGTNYATTPTSNSFAPNTNTWYHFCSTINPNSPHILYVNGVQVAQSSITPSGSLFSTTTQLRFGGQPYTIGNNTYQGYVDDFRVYNRALSATEVAALAGNVGIPQAPPSANLTTNLTFDNTTADAQNSLPAPTTTGTVAYSPNCKVGTASLDLTGSTVGGTPVAVVTYSLPTKLTTPFSTSVWINPSSTTYSAIFAFSASSITSYNFSFQMLINTQLQLDFWINGSSTNQGGTIPGTIKTGQWYNVATTLTSEGNLQVYVNGNQVLQKSIPAVTSLSVYGGFSGNIDQLKLGCNIGANTTTNTNAYKGLIDDLRMYSSALTPAQVAGLYCSTPNIGYVLYQQPIEGINIADLAWGTSAAQPVTVSAWIKNNSVATSNSQQLALSLQNGTNNRSYVYTTPLLPANNWSKVSFTVPGDSNGTWATANSSTGVNLALALGTANIYSVPTQVVATTSGATVTTVSNYTICSYTTVGSSTFTVTAPGLIDFLVIAGGGGGAGDRGPGGGAGGCIYGQNVSIAAGTYTVTVGGGGAGGYQTNGSAGGDSAFSIWTAKGGGGGGFYINGFAGGCGGGGHGQWSCPGGAALIGGQGFAGGDGYNNMSGGGGGIGGLGNSGNSVGGGDGGAGLGFSISGTFTYYGGGGGGSRSYDGGGGYSGQGGIGGGGAAGQTAGANGANGTPNTGGGGGGSANQPVASGGSGGSGIVIIRYMTNVSASGWNGAQYLTSNVQVFGQSNAFLGNLGNSLLLTGVQLEKGTLATPYEYRPYAVENVLSSAVVNNGIVKTNMMPMGNWNFQQVTAETTFTPMGGIPVTLNSATSTYYTSSTSAQMQSCMIMSVPLTLLAGDLVELVARIHGETNGNEHDMKFSFWKVDSTTITNNIDLAMCNYAASKTTTLPYTNITTGSGRLQKFDSEGFYNDSDYNSTAQIHNLRAIYRTPVSGVTTFYVVMSQNNGGGTVFAWNRCWGNGGDESSEHGTSLFTARVL